jgi:hypothetical protein
VNSVCASAQAPLLPLHFPPATITGAAAAAEPAVIPVSLQFCRVQQRQPNDCSLTAASLFQFSIDFELKWKLKP